MNGIRSVSFQEVPGGLLVHVRKESKTSSSGKLKKRLPSFVMAFIDAIEQIVN